MLAPWKKRYIYLDLGGFSGETRLVRTMAKQFMVQNGDINNHKRGFLLKNVILSKPKSTIKVSYLFSVSCFILFHEKIIKPMFQT